MIDTHCHLTDERLETEIEIERAKGAGVGRMITLGTSLVDSQKAIEIAERFEGVYCAVGIHPEAADYLGFSPFKVEEKIEKLAFHQKVVAIGEIGLDWWWTEHSFSFHKMPEGTEKARHENRLLQKEIFRIQLKCAVALDLPVVIHNRGADGEALEIIDEFKGRVSGVFHCFSQGERFLREVLARGFYVGFAGNITFKKNQALGEVAKLVPGDRILVETDAPYLTPEPFRGEWPNTPANVKIMAAVLAGLRGVTLAEFEKQTTENALRLFTKMRNQ